MMSLMNSLYVFGLVDGKFLIEWLNDKMAQLEKERNDHDAKFNAETICNEKSGSRREPTRMAAKEEDEEEPTFYCCFRMKKDDDKDRSKNNQLVHLSDDGSDSDTARDRLTPNKNT